MWCLTAVAYNGIESMNWEMPLIHEFKKIKHKYNIAFYMESKIKNEILAKKTTFIVPTLYSYEKKIDFKLRSQAIFHVQWYEKMNMIFNFWQRFSDHFCCVFFYIVSNHKLTNCYFLMQTPLLYCKHLSFE